MSILHQLAARCVEVAVAIDRLGPTRRTTALVMAARQFKSAVELFEEGERVAVR